MDALNLVDTGQPDDTNGAPFSVAELPTGWAVLWANDEQYANDDRATALSRTGSPILAVHVNETCMHSTAALFTNGEMTWRLHHEGDERIDFLDRKGALPSEAGSIESILRAKQVEEDAGRAEVDYLFDVPLEVARSVCGYKHDMGWFARGEPLFTVAQPLVSHEQSASLLRRLFGRS